MKFSVQKSLPAKIPSVIFAYAGEPLKKVLSMCGLDGARLPQAPFDGALGETMVFLHAQRTILICGLGEMASKESPEVLRKAGGLLAKFVKKSQWVEFAVTPRPEHLHPEFVQALVEGWIEGRYAFQHYLTDKKEFLTHQIVLIASNRKLEDAMRKGLLIGETVNHVRDLINIPSCDMTPSDLADLALELASPPYLSVKVFSEAQIKKLGMGLLYGVGQGSSHETKFIVLEYQGKSAKQPPIAVVGKGITFDSGGLSLKPPKFLIDMKLDMAGAATVLGLFRLLKAYRPDVHVIGLIPVAENMLGEYSIKPGDILRAYNGKTVEILNTDAEGRLILADALAYGVKHFQPALVIDVATLTGACSEALGYETTAIMSNATNVKDHLIALAKETGEKIWELPLDQDLKGKVKGDIADLKNAVFGIGAGAITAALFLEEFVGKTPWVHLDMGLSAFATEEGAYYPKGATGRMVRLLWRFLETYE